MTLGDLVIIILLVIVACKKTNHESELNDLDFRLRRIDDRLKNIERIDYESRAGTRKR